MPGLDRERAGEGWQEAVCLTDPAYSGGTMNRPGLQALKRMIGAGEIKVLLVFKLERLSRNVDEFGPFRAFLNQHGCELVSATEDIAEAEPEGRLKNNIILAVSDFERRNTAKKVRIKMHEQAKRGIWNGGLVPYGFNYDLNTQQLTPHAKESEIVRQMFTEAAALIPLTDIAQALNAAGHRTKPREYVGRDGVSRQAGAVHFRADGLRLILSNPLYRGAERFGGEEFASKHEALVPAELWERANAAIHHFPPRERPPVLVDRDKHFHLLKGLAYCGHCQRALIPHASGKQDPAGKPYRYYDCGQIVKRSHDHECPVGRLAAGALESVVVGFLEEIGKHEAITRRALEISRSAKQVDGGPLRTALRETEQALTAINTQVTNCVNAIAASADVLGDELKQRVLARRTERQVLIVRREQLEQSLRPCSEQTLSEKRILSAFQNFSELLPQMAPAAQKQLLGLMVARIEARVGKRAAPGLPGRVLQFEVKLNLPQLVEGMEEKVLLADGRRRSVAPLQRTIAFTIRAAVGSQGRALKDSPR